MDKMQGPRTRGGGWNEIAMEAELGEVWLFLGRHAEDKAGKFRVVEKRKEGGKRAMVRQAAWTVESPSEEVVQPEARLSLWRAAVTILC